MARFSPRRPLLTKLLIVAGLLLVSAYFVLRLRQSSAWTLARPAYTIAVPSSPPLPPAIIPEKLWYKLGPNGLNDELRHFTESCTAKNPNFQVEIMTDDQGDDFVKSHFASRHDIVDNFLAIQVPIIKADLLRYLVLYEYGGIWNDLDVSCEVPVREWVPEQYQANASVVVGLEFDVDIWVRQFATWTIAAKEKSPHLLATVEDCIDALVQKSKELGVGIQDLRLNTIDDVVDVSGPRRLTRGILKSLSRMLNRTVEEGEISHVTAPRLIGDVLVLPDCAFADSMNQQHGDKKIGPVLVTHHYAGSWKNEQGGEELRTREAVS